MTWVKLSDTFADDPRLESAGTEAFALHVAGLCYCSRQLTDGRVSTSRALRLWPVEDPVAAVEALVREGLWERGEDGSYLILDYLSDQPSAERVREQRALKAKRQEAWRSKQSGRTASHDASVDASRNASQDGLVDPAPPRPAPKEAGRGARRPSTGRATPPQDAERELEQLEQSGDDGRRAVEQARRVLQDDTAAVAVLGEARRQLDYQREDEGL